MLKPSCIELDGTGFKQCSNSEGCTNNYKGGFAGDTEHIAILTTKLLLLLFDQLSSPSQRGRARDHGEMRNTALCSNTATLIGMLLLASNSISFFKCLLLVHPTHLIAMQEKAIHS